MFYRGNKTLEKRQHDRTLPSIIGVLEKIPTELLSTFPYVSIFTKTRVCEYDRVMLGPTRFANHSCRPNCRYVLKEINSMQCIQLEIVNTIYTGDEITVSYGDGFFGEGNQDYLCRHVDKHQDKPTLLVSNSVRKTGLVLPVLPSRRRCVSVLREKVLGRRRLRKNQKWRCELSMEVLAAQILILFPRPPQHSFLTK